MSPTLGLIVVVVLAMASLQGLRALVPGLPTAPLHAGLVLVIGGLVVLHGVHGAHTQLLTWSPALHQAAIALVALVLTAAFLDAHNARSLGTGTHAGPLSRDWPLLGLGLALAHATMLPALDPAPLNNWEDIVRTLDAVWWLAVRWTAPCWSAALLLDLTAGLLQRIWPALPATFLAMPMRVLVVTPLVAILLSSR